MGKLSLIFGLLLLGLSVICQSQTGERLYFQLDKAGYTAGETIWFKAYIFENFYPGTKSSTIQIDLLDRSGKLVNSKRLPIFGGTATGNIDLPITSTQGIYFLRANTKTAVISAITDLYIKPLFVFNPIISGTPDAARFTNEYIFKFYTGSDNLVAATKNIIFFKATDQFGLPVNIKGSILNTKKEELMIFEDTYNGMGKFEIIPVTGEKYYAHIIFPDGVVKEFSLPEPLTKGVVINVTNDLKGKLVTVNILDLNTKNEEYTIIGVMDNNIVFNQLFPVKQSNKFLIQTQELPTGAVQFFVIDPKHRILANTVSFVNDETSYLPIKFVTDTLNTSSKGKNIFSMIFPDSSTGSYSISITDYDRELRSPQNNILTDLLLIPQTLNRSIINYVDIKEGLNKQDEKIGLLMATSEWLPADLNKLLKPVIENVTADTNYIVIKGKVFKRNNQPVTKGDLTFIFQGKDSATSFFTSPIKSDGSFLLKNLVYYDTAIFKYQLNNTKQDEIFIKLDSLYKSNPISIPPSLSLIPFDQSIFSNPILVKQSTENFKYLSDTFSNAKRLKEVVVTVKKVTPTQQVNDKYTRGLFQNSNMARVVDLINNPPNLSGNIFDYLQGQISSLIITKSGFGYLLGSARSGLSLSYNAGIKLYLNEQEVVQEMITMIPLYEIALVKYYPPGNSMLPGIGGAGVLAVYTKKPGDSNYSSKSVLGSFIYPGYSPIKYFETDNLARQTEAYNHRTTLYWDPYIFINGDNRTQTIKFINSDVAKRFHIVIEGFTTEGKLLHFEKVIE